MVESFFRSFLAGETASQSLLAASFRDPQRRGAHVQRAAQRSIAPGLLEVLRRQNETLAPSDARARNLEALARSGTTAVVTGQQLGLFLGGRRTIKKKKTAIAAARWKGRFLWIIYGFPWLGIGARNMKKRARHPRGERRR